MASAAVAIPPFNKINMIGIWMETVLYGINLVVYGACIYVTMRKTRSRSPRWILAISATLQFTLATVHAGASFQQLLDCFVYQPVATGAPPSDLFWIALNLKPAVIKLMVYVTAVWLQDLTLIWRLYVVWGKNWLICVLPLLVDCVRIGAGYYSAALATNPSLNINSKTVSQWGLVGWSLDLVVNICVTCAIAVRLWWMGRKVRHITSHDSGIGQYTSVIFTIVESGGLYTANTVTILAIYLSGSAIQITTLDLSTQIAVLTPLLIVVRVGLGLTHGLPKAYREQQGISTRISARGETYGPPAIQVNVSRNVETDDLYTSSKASDSGSSYALKDLKTAA